MEGSNRIATPGGEQEMLTLSEQGLYFFLGRSDKPRALPFQKWLAGEVLPAIRKTGKYEKQPHPLPNGWRDRKPRPGESPRERDNRLKRQEEHCTHNEGRPIEAAVNYWCALRGIRRLDALAAIRVRFGLRIFNRPPCISMRRSSTGSASSAARTFHACPQATPQKSRSSWSSAREPNPATCRQSPCASARP